MIKILDEPSEAFMCINLSEKMFGRKPGAQIKMDCYIISTEARLKMITCSAAEVQN